MDDEILEPLIAYKERFAREFNDNAETYFNDLVKKSGIDAEANRKTAAAYRHEANMVAEMNKTLSKHSAVKGFLIFLAVSGFILIAVGIAMLVYENYLAGSLCLVFGVIAAVVGIAINSTVIKKKIAAAEKKKASHAAQAEKYMKEAQEQMLPLNALFESEITHALVQKTVPLIKLDKNFNMQRFEFLNKKYGFSDNTNPKSSTIALLSGEIIGNPFIVDRELIQNMGTETYSGSIVIHWTTTYVDSDGHSHVQHHSQTLVATVTKPKPYYSKQTRLIYGNEAAPDLSFSHTPTHAERLDEKDLEDTVKSGMKKIQKQQKKNLQNNSSFTEMGNAEFDVLFNALDRDNEVQFRLLFTPLAQKNMLSLMKDKTGYGDDFNFFKRKMLNYVSSEHSTTWDLDTNCTRYHSYDVDDSKQKFMSYNANFFKSLYFELAPLLSIPLYQQHKPREFIYKDTYSRNYTNYEAECLVNRLGTQYLEHPLARTKNILKTSMQEKDGKTDILTVTAHSFKTERRVDYVQKLGGDGYMHTIPVEWIEYIPVSQDSVVSLKELDMTEKQYNGRFGSGTSTPIDKVTATRAFTHCLMCCLLTASGESIDSMIDNALK